MQKATKESSGSISSAFRAHPVPPSLVRIFSHIVSRRLDEYVFYDTVLVRLFGFAAKRPKEILLLMKIDCQTFVTGSPVETPPLQGFYSTISGMR